MVALGLSSSVLAWWGTGALSGAAAGWLMWRQVEAVLRAGPASREGELCVQEVFGLLDVLHQWVAQARAASSPAATTAATSTGPALLAC
jgi:hypothetical protein